MNKINYQLPYKFATWTNNWSWYPHSSHQFKQNQTLKRPRNRGAPTQVACTIKDKIISNCKANKLDDNANFDSVIKGMSNYIEVN